MSNHENITANLPALSTRLAKVASALSGNSGIKITFSGNDCCTDMQGNIRLPVALAIAMAEGDENAKRLMFGKVAHEKGHDAVQRSTSFLSKAKKKATVNADVLALATATPKGAEMAITKKNGALTPVTLMKRLPTKSHRMWFNAIEDVRMERSLTLDGERAFTAHNRLVAAGTWRKNIEAGHEVHPMLATSVAVIFQAHNIDIDFMPAEVQAALAILTPFTAALGTDAAGDTKVKTVWDAYNLAIAIVEFINEAGEGEGDVPSDNGEEGEGQEGEAGEQDGESGLGDEGEGDAADDQDGEGQAEGDEDGEGDEGQGEGQGIGDDDAEGQAEGQEGNEGEGQGDEGEGEGQQDQDGHDNLSEAGDEDGEASTGAYKNAATGDNDMTDVENIDVSGVKATLKGAQDHQLKEEPLEDAIDEAIVQSGRAVYNDLPVDLKTEVNQAWTVNEKTMKGDRITTPEPTSWEIEKFNAANLGGTAATIAGQLRALLTTRSLARTQGDQLEGRLDRRALHRLNRPGMLPARNVFAKTVKGQATNVAIMVMLDCSGSMWGTKMSVARKALHLVGNALTMLEPLGVKWAANGFTTRRDSQASKYINWDGSDRAESLQHYRFKGFGESFRRAEVGARVYSHSIQLGNNCDSESIQWGINELLKVKADRHIVLVLSDGQPAFRGSSSGKRQLKEVIEGARKAGVQVGSIGICTNDPKAYYGQDTPTIHDAEELPQAIMEQARSWFLG